MLCENCSQLQLFGYCNGEPVFGYYPAEIHPTGHIIIEKVTEHIITEKVTEHIITEKVTNIPLLDATKQKKRKCWKCGLTINDYGD